MFTFNTGEFTVQVNTTKIYGDPFELINKLYKIRQDDTLSKEEKKLKVQEAIKAYRGE